MKTLIAFLIIFKSVSVLGQIHYIGSKGGLNLTNIVSDNFISENGSRVGGVGGLTYEYQFENKFNIGFDLLYAQKGFTYDLIFTDELGNQVGQDAITQFNYDYLSLPIKGGYSISYKVEGFVNLGIVPSFLIKAEEIIPGIGSVNGSYFAKPDGVREFDLGGLVEIGGSYKLKERFLLYAAVAYQQSFLTLNENDPINWTARHQGMNVSVGVKYALSAKG